MIRKVYLIKRGEGYRGSKDSKYSYETHKGEPVIVPFERARLYPRKCDASNSFNCTRFKEMDTLTEAYLITPDELEKIKQWDDLQAGIKQLTEKLAKERRNKPDHPPIWSPWDRRY